MASDPPAPVSTSSSGDEFDQWKAGGDAALEALKELPADDFREESTEVRGPIRVTAETMPSEPNRVTSSMLPAPLRKLKHGKMIASAIIAIAGFATAWAQGKDLAWALERAWKVFVGN